MSSLIRLHAAADLEFCEGSRIRGASEAWKAESGVDPPAGAFLTLYFKWYTYTCELFRWSLIRPCLTEISNFC